MIDLCMQKVTSLESEFSNSQAEKLEILKDILYEAIKVFYFE